MKVLTRALILCGTLSVLAGPAMAGKVVPLNCQTGDCKYSEEMGPDQTHEYRGFCAGENAFEFKMACHPVKGMTCTAATAVDPYWSCMCTNWNSTDRKHVSVDLECKY